MSEAENPFSKMQAAEKKRGRPPTKPPVGETQKDKPPVGETRRIPVGLRKKENATTREGFYRRWVNDIEDRIHIFEEGGYTQVKGEDGNPRIKRVGGGRQAVLMEIDEDIYNKDQQAKYDKWNKDNQERLKPREGSGYYQPKTKL